MIDFNDLETLRAFALMGLFAVLLVAACAIAVVDAVKRRQREQTIAEARERKIQTEVKRLRREAKLKRVQAMRDAAEGTGGLPA